VELVAGQICVVRRSRGVQNKQNLPKLGGVLGVDPAGVIIVVELLQAAMTNPPNHG
jgi:hypothetical protein